MEEIEYDYRIPSTIVVERDDLSPDSLFVKQQANRYNMCTRDWLTCYYYVMVYSVGDDKASEKTIWRRAAEQAGYSKRVDVEKRFINNENVASLVAELRQRNIILVNERLKSFQLNADRVLAELSCTAFLDPRRCFDEKGKLLPISEMGEVEARAIKSIKYDRHGKPTVYFNDKGRALELLMRHLGMLQTNINVKSKSEVVHKTQITEFRMQMENLSVEELEQLQLLMKKAQHPELAQEFDKVQSVDDRTKTTITLDASDVVGNDQPVLVDDLIK